MFMIRGKIKKTGHQRSGAENLDKPLSGISATTKAH